jgi:hypothetical protein
MENIFTLRNFAIGRFAMVVNWSSQRVSIKDLLSIAYPTQKIDFTKKYIYTDMGRIICTDNKPFIPCVLHDQVEYYNHEMPKVGDIVELRFQYNAKVTSLYNNGIFGYLLNDYSKKLIQIDKINITNNLTKTENEKNRINYESRIGNAIYGAKNSRGRITVGFRYTGNETRIIKEKIRIKTAKVKN